MGSAMTRTIGIDTTTFGSASATTTIGSATMATTTTIGSATMTIGACGTLAVSAPTTIGARETLSEASTPQGNDVILPDTTDDVVYRTSLNEELLRVAERHDNKELHFITSILFMPTACAISSEGGGAHVAANDELHFITSILFMPTACAISSEGGGAHVAADDVLTFNLFGTHGVRKPLLWPERPPICLRVVMLTLVIVAGNVELFDAVNPPNRKPVRWKRWFDKKMTSQDYPRWSPGIDPLKRQSQEPCFFPATAQNAPKRLKTRSTTPCAYQAPVPTSATRLVEGATLSVSAEEATLSVSAAVSAEEAALSTEEATLPEISAEKATLSAEEATLLEINIVVVYRTNFSGKLLHVADRHDTEPVHKRATRSVQEATLSAAETDAARTTITSGTTTTATFPEGAKAFETNSQRAMTLHAELNSTKSRCAIWIHMPTGFQKSCAPIKRQHRTAPRVYQASVHSTSEQRRFRKRAQLPTAPVYRHGTVYEPDQQTNSSSLLNLKLNSSSLKSYLDTLQSVT
jgi:hypothetical protein